MSEAQATATNSDSPPPKRQKKDDAVAGGYSTTRTCSDYTFKDASDRTPSAAEPPHSDVGLNDLPEALKTKLLVELIGDASNDIVCLVRLASISKEWNRRVYSDNVASLFKKVDFSVVSSGCRGRLTDRLLLGFLRRVDAKAVTEELSLASCGRINGRGIGPLRGSKVLRKLDLRFVPDGGSRPGDIEWDSLHRTLSGIAPFAKVKITSRDNVTATASTVGLQMLRLPPISQSSADKHCRQLKQQYSNMIKTFHKAFNKQKASTDRSNANLNDASSTCKKCKGPRKKIFVSDFVSSCSIKSICRECDSDGPFCKFCGKAESSATEWRTCAISTSLSCGSCKDNVRSCSRCSLSVGLNHDRSDEEPWRVEPPVAECSGCREVACSTCREHSRCCHCRRDFCRSCCIMAVCGQCDGKYCSRCSQVMSTCGACGDNFCGNNSKCESDHFKNCVSSSYRRSVF